jgi:ABC-type transporter Mla maintaining outer membrane lipid asymmetry ATPase subunit MlaF
MSIWKFLLRVLRKANVVPYIIVAIIIIFGLAYTIFQQSVLMQSDLDLYSTITKLIYYTIIERLLKAINELIVAYFIMLPFKLTATEHISEAIVSRSPTSLLLMKNNAYVLKNAALRALQSLVENSLAVIIPIVLLISRGVAIGVYLNVTQLFIVIACLTGVFLAGSAILAYDHRVKQELSKKETLIEEQTRSLMKSIATIVVNGMSSILPNMMKTLKRDEAEPNTKHEVIMSIMYGVLDISTTNIPIILVWMLKGSDGNDAFLPIYIVIQPMFWNSWYLFCTVKSLVVSTSSWVQFEEFMDTSRPLPVDVIEPTSAADMMKIFKNPAFKEIRIIGNSGDGKSYLIKKIISQICDRFALGFIIYIDQFTSLPQGMTLKQYFSSAFQNPVECMHKLFEYAEILGISNIVNEQNIEMPFSNPSGGETKKLVLLRYILPILMGESNIMILFLDEVSAGLDDISFTKVRSLIEEVKAKGVKVVSIDHHEYPTDYNVKVFKKIIPANYSHLQSNKKDQSLIHRIFPHMYHKKEEIAIKTGHEPTEIIVWSPELDIEEPD